MTTNPSPSQGSEQPLQPSKKRPPSVEDIKAEIKLKKEMFLPRANEVRQRLAEIEDILAGDTRFMFVDKDPQDLTEKEKTFKAQHMPEYNALLAEMRELTEEKERNNSLIISYQLYGMSEADSERLAESEKYFHQHIAPAVELNEEVLHLVHEYNVDKSVAIAYLINKQNQQNGK